MSSDLRRRYAAYRWTPATNGASGAEVHHLTGAGTGEPELYVKAAPVTPDGSPSDLSDEADRLAWLAGRGIPVPRIVERGADDRVAWLVTEAVPGRPAADEWPPEQRSAVAESLADLAAALHRLPSADCPFDRGLPVTMELAARNVAEGLVDLADLDEERAGWTGQRLLDELRRTRPATEDPVVTHGDLTPENVLLDPVTCRVTGVIDVVRLGRADRHTDLAVLLRELSHEEDPWFGPAHAERFLRRYEERVVASETDVVDAVDAADVVDKEKLAFYQLLDEFF
ncbi:APH(3') family aminoglycoside O-phosphotransferase [Streptomyces sp. NPDC093510]|uniref:APH(3') family aminoglycoside O-phosphotransferase n=1 Tax=Streptomyces sp. NPDC093510 TaxID=3155199 RepID=UPI00342E2E02